ncbi:MULTISPECIES: BolA family protein [Marinobacter]|uniref:BolA/IbaG family iron-sulfur metabolism protein n=1 Tax=Marinobacter xestospongiae TaxID=994319 RepID=A0ABU3VS12_9GAMM|nr:MULTISPECIES: BolA/IbaG family iron-sulfur metabolism protein [Marinobacter]MCG8516496.1 BolA/IbaG family iron-sulfur metabolism protein [Pseudomonadales bacterium]MCK7567013.1 BolA/IbaG family iron-sulfur metabolism protein [Marinobacter xestospongiae]MDV2077065.1 BolA/IbaG family iron-sulfur metabolism protein [Marinobacter xestospongiae]UDL03880.1 BolA/IbaG family iron-sulfur metabolism protein [Marinobacter sp. CA1]
MEAREVAELVKQALPDCEIDVQSEGNHYLVVAVGDRFEGLSPVKKQQLIYGALEQQLAEGTIHALTIKAFTPAQWAARQA